MTYIAFSLARVGTLALAFLLPVTSPAGAGQVPGERGSRTLAISTLRAFAESQGAHQKRGTVHRVVEGVTTRNGSQTVDLAAGYRWGAQQVVSRAGLGRDRSAEANILRVQLRRERTGPRSDSYAAGYKWGGHKG